MTRLFEKNIARLSELSPEIASAVRLAQRPSDAKVFASANGPPTASVGGVSLHSRYDPVGEAAVWADGATPGTDVTVFGFGLGHHILALAKKTSSITIIEPDPGMVRLGFENLDFHAVMDRLHFVFKGPNKREPITGPILHYAPSVRLNRKLFERWQVFTVGNIEESAEEMATGCGEIKGIWELLEQKASKDTVTLRNLTRAALKKNGPPSEGAVYVLLIDELTRI